VGGKVSQPLLGEGPAVAPPDQQIVDRLAIGPVLREAMTVLTPRQRAIIDGLVLVEPLSYASSARELQCPVGSLGPSRMRALARLRAVPAVAALVSD
jgi:DNA-directed RNA polymerase specialized sigma24 family protein